MELSTQAPHRIVHGPSKVTVPFYAPPSNIKKTSAEIISEARAAIFKGSGDMTGTAASIGIGIIKPLDTKRPFTPRDRQRTLYGSSVAGTTAAASHRPPSSFSLGDLQFQEIEGAGNTPPLRRLNPIPLTSLDSPIDNAVETIIKKSTQSVDGFSRFKLPSIDAGRRKQFRNTVSLDNLPEELEVDEIDDTDAVTERKAYSSPVQRTHSYQEEQLLQQPSSPVPAKRSLPSSSRTPAAIEAWMDGGNKKAKRCNSMTTEKEDGQLIVNNVESMKYSEPQSHLSSNNEGIQPVQKRYYSGKKSRSTAKEGKMKNDPKVTHTDTVTDHHEDYSMENTHFKSSDNNIYVESLTTQQSHLCSERPTRLKPPNFKPARPLSVQHSSEKLNKIEDPILEPIYKALKENLPPEDCTIQGAIKKLTILAKNDGDDSEVISVMLKLYKALETERTAGPHQHNGKVKSQVLKALYKYIERNNEVLLLQIARIILALRVTGTNLSAVCKLVFKISRTDKNDKLFLEDNSLEMFVNALGYASPLEDAEACVYGYGALKFLTMNPALLSRVLGLGALELMVLHIKIINSAKAEGLRIPEQTSHALFQLTGALRNVAGEETMFPQFVSTGAVTALCHAMDLFSSDLDVISNSSRTLSIISTHDDCCDSIIAYEGCFGLFTRLMKKYPGRQDIIVRLGYALGNLMAKSDAARTKLYMEDGAVTTILDILSLYLEKDLYADNNAQSRGVCNQSSVGSTGSIQDVIIKLIRILANMTINPEVGSSFTFVDGSGNSLDSSKEGTRFLDMLLSLLERKSVAVSEHCELLHSVLSTLNNLSYYQTASFGSRERDIACALVDILKSDSKDCLVEAMRVYGNLSRSETSRNILLENAGLSCLLHNLELSDRELLCATAGVIINMMSDWDKRFALRQIGGIERMITVLSEFGEKDWQLATFLCQALWNFCTESNDLHAALGTEETNELLTVLADFLDEERLFGIVEGTEASEAVTSSHHYQQWEEFAGVATNLLEKIETFLDSVESSVSSEKSDRSMRK